MHRWIFFACWYTFSKAKSQLSDVWLDVAKSGHGFLIHETQKMMYLQNGFMN